MERIKGRLDELRNRLVISKHNREQIEKYREQEEVGARTLNLLHVEQQLLYETSRTLLDYRAKKRVQDSNQITGTVTAIANLVFPEYDYTYVLDSRVSRGYTYTDLLFKDSQGRKFVPRHSNGNGLQQLISFGSVATITALSDITPTLWLDECLSSISPDKAPVAGEILKRYADYGFQMILIEHEDRLFENIDYTEISLWNDNGETVLTGIREVNNSGNVD